MDRTRIKPHMPVFLFQKLTWKGWKTLNFFQPPGAFYRLDESIAPFMEALKEWGYPEGKGWPEDGSRAYKLLEEYEESISPRPPTEKPFNWRRS